MKITIKTFTQTREITKTPSLELDVEEKATVASVMAKLQERDENWSLALDASVLTACNHQLCEKDMVLCDGDEVAFFPPVTGG